MHRTAAVQYRRPGVRQAARGLAQVLLAPIQSLENILNDVLGRGQISDHNDGQVNELQMVSAKQFSHRLRGYGYALPGSGGDSRYGQVVSIGAISLAGHSGHHRIHAEETLSYRSALPSGFRSHSRGWRTGEVAHVGPDQNVWIVPSWQPSPPLPASLKASSTA
jgi:hypothetical protein